MNLTKQRQAVRGGGRVVVFLSIVCCVVPALGHAADVLFPKPLHLTRRIEDPLSAAPMTVDEYCAGNRMVSVQGDRVVIADYEKQVITEIDRAAGTYSTTRFDEVARAIPTGSAHSQRATRTIARPLGTHQSETGRPVERFEVTAGETRIEFGVDRSLQLSRGAVDVLLGGAWPNAPSPHHEQLAAAIGSGMPAEQIITTDFEGQRIVLRNIVTRVGDELVPAELITILPGSRRVDSHFTLLNGSVDGSGPR